ncbi:GAF domain-containing protein [Pseudonocardia sp. CA-107938]|uniref:GAF domain-containing protein n=1 Tax=Pseudonocardia sp. CA-107938 TaxID=3240021 RepID=UPI003D8CB0AF
MRVFEVSSTAGCGGVVVLEAVQDLDLATEAAARADLGLLLRRHRDQAVVIDCSGVFVALRGMYVLSDVIGSMQPDDIPVRVVVGHAVLHWVNRMIGCPLVLEPSVPDAVAAATAPQLPRLTAVRSVEELLAAAPEILRVDGVGLMLLDEHDRLRPIGASDPISELLQEAQQVEGFGPAHDVVRTGAVVEVVDLDLDIRYAGLRVCAGAPGGTSVRGVVSAPVCVGGRVLGAFTVMRTGTEGWTGVQRRAILACAAVIGSVLAVHGAGSASA